MTTPDLPVLIIGGGFSGTMLAARLAEMGKASVVIEPCAEMGLGVAYGTTEDVHRLNVRTANMGAVAERPDDFQQWLTVHHPAYADPEGFAPRRLYGRYIQHRISTVCSQHRQLLHGVRGRVVAINQNTVILEDGQALMGCAIVLATGNPPPRAATADQSPRQIANPWAPRALAQIGIHDSVAIIGTGLTMVDVLLSLQDRGWKGQAFALSRRGLAPRSHLQGRHQAAALPAAALEGPLSQRLHAARTLAKTVEWRDIMDGYRSRTADLWASASHSQRARFLRHLRPWWDVHRHRIAPDVAQTLQDLRNADRLSLHAGRVLAVHSGPVSLSIDWMPRGTHARVTTDAQWMIDCTGPGHAPMDDALLAPLLAAGRLSMDPLGLGLEVSLQGQAINAQGTADGTLYVLGPPARAAFWESIAVPDLRTRIEQMAQQLAH